MASIYHPFDEHLHNQIYKPSFLPVLWYQITLAFLFLFSTRLLEHPNVRIIIERKGIREEASERFGFYEKEIDKSVKNLYQKKMGKIPDYDLMKKLSKRFVWWFLDEFELTKKQLKIIQN